MLSKILSFLFPKNGPKYEIELYYIGGEPMYDVQYKPCSGLSRWSSLGWFEILADAKNAVEEHKNFQRMMDEKEIL